ncbi:MAG: AAA family ATPase [Chitinophagaceae bacterium]|nr:AAA family ATPase [Chitinophagaceae bacterium]
MSISIDPQVAAAKKEKLNQIAATLKQEFFDLDDIIDNIISLITPWYLYPHLQERPVIINLWGLTGVGKTSLVKRLVELLEFREDFFEIDMTKAKKGEGNVALFMRNYIKRGGPYPLVLALDEFQHAYTLKQKKEKGDSKSDSSIWKLFDTGKIQIYNPFEETASIERRVKMLQHMLDNGVEVEHGMVVGKKLYFNKMCQLLDLHTSWHRVPDEYEYDSTEVETKLDTEHTKLKRFVTEEIENHLFSLIRYRYPHAMAFRDEFLTKNGIESIEFINDLLQEIRLNSELDCQQYLIFILGNLDEAYSCHQYAGADISADHFHRICKRITVKEIKEALQFRFRNEQIARLGNNHIIYPSLRSAAYKGIIIKELSQIIEKSATNFGYTLRFDPSIYTLIYKEGVYPTQGTRPVYSTIQKIVTPLIAAIPAIIAIEYPNTKRVDIAYARGYYKISLYTGEGKLLLFLKQKALLQLAPLLKSIPDDLQASIAVHEAGHTVAFIFLLGALPDKISAKSSDGGGFNLMSMSDRYVWNRKRELYHVACYMAGREAERLVFGNHDLVSMGSSSDITNATAILISMVKRNGLGSMNTKVLAPSSIGIDGSYDNNFLADAEVENLMQEAVDIAKNVLLDNINFLKILARYLADKPILHKPQIAKLLKEHTGMDEEQLKKRFATNYREILFNKEN